MPRRETAPGAPVASHHRPNPATSTVALRSLISRPEGRFYPPGRPAVRVDPTVGERGRRGGRTAAQPGSPARSALHVVEYLRPRGERIGLLELQTLWPFPENLVREQCEQAKYVIVVEMNMGQIIHEVKRAVEQPQKVFLANRIDGVFITPMDIRNIMRLVQGKGV